MPDTTSACKANEVENEKTLTLTHDFSNQTTTMTFITESSSFSYSIQNDSTVIKEALEGMIVSL